MLTNYSEFYELEGMDYHKGDCAHCWYDFSYHFKVVQTNEELVKIMLHERPILCKDCAWVINQNHYKPFINSLRDEFLSYSGKVDSENYGMEVFQGMIAKYEKEFKNEEEKLMVFYMTMHPLVGEYKGGYDDSLLSETVQKKIDMYFKKSETLKRK